MSGRPHPIERIASLVPAATETVAALGGAHLLEAISHECDYPASVQRLPRITTTPLDPTMNGAGIDRAVRALRERGAPVIAVDADALASVRPDLVITQELCAVCAVADGEVRALTAGLDPAPDVLTLGARTIDGIFSDIRAIGERIDLADDADELVAGLAFRLSRLRRMPVSGPPPRVVVVEWLEPLFLAGHWVPELVAAAGGQDVGAQAGAHSRERTWEDAAALAPDLVLIALCGLAVPRALDEWRRFVGKGGSSGRIAATLGAATWVIDGNAYTSRGGPRVVDGAELIRSAITGTEAPGLVRVR